MSIQSIKERSDQEAKELKLFYDESNQPGNRRLNRYRDVNPYDHSRIILHKGDGDYINANLVKVSLHFCIQFTISIINIKIKKITYRWKRQNENIY